MSVDSRRVREGRESRSRCRRTFRLIREPEPSVFLAGGSAKGSQRSSDKPSPRTPGSRRDRIRIPLPFSFVLAAVAVGRRTARNPFPEFELRVRARAPLLYVRLCAVVALAPIEFNLKKREAGREGGRIASGIAFICMFEMAEAKRAANRFEKSPPKYSNTRVRASTSVCS